MSKAQSEANHRAIEAAASRLFRERGLHGVTVADVMAEAGLTHGGFYVKQIDMLAVLGASGNPTRDRADACTRLATMMGALLLARACHGHPLADEIVAAARARLAADDAIRRPSRTSSPRRTKSKSGAR